MLDSLPSTIRDRLWGTKLAGVGWLHSRGDAHSLDVLLERQLRHFGTTMFLDVGANVGQSVRLLRRLRRADVLMVRPGPDPVALGTS